MASNEVALKFTGNATSAIGALRAVGDQAEKTGSKFRKRLVAGAKLAAAAIGVALVGAAAKGIKGAVDLEESIAKTQVVFKNSAKGILDWSKTTADSIGISRNEALAATGVFGNMLVPMGLARPLAAQMSRQMVILAGDMASFNNASPAETLDALRSGLAGETEPLRRFGVFLNAARIKQEALNLGLSDGTRELTAAEKAQATYSIILKDTADAQGDFARTSDSAANQSRQLRARFDDLTTQLGAKLLPVVNKFLGFLLDMIDFAARVANWGGWSKIASVVGGVFGDIADDVRTVIGWINRVIGAGQAVINWGGWGVIGSVISAPFRAAIGAIQAVIGAIQTVISTARAAIDAVRDFLGVGGPGISSLSAAQQARIRSRIPQRRAHGGIVTSPELSLIGEAGPEAVIPLNRPNRARQIMAEAGLGGSGVTVNVNGLVVREMADVDLIAARISRMVAMRAA